MFPKIRRKNMFKSATFVRRFFDEISCMHACSWKQRMPHLSRFGTHPISSSQDITLPGLEVGGPGGLARYVTCQSWTYNAGFIHIMWSCMLANLLTWITRLFPGLKTIQVHQPLAKRCKGVTADKETTGLTQAGWLHFQDKCSQNLRIA